ncbi:MAG: histidine triad nucleotide-binding protein [Deltaproteobacteria bacterium]|nr:histidine triad nucleotide-binding protein [Deltaproteobacteria bacterium]
MSECIFCKIAAGTIPATLLYEGPLVVAFPDLHPKAPVHLLIIPREHLPTWNAVPANATALLSEMTLAIHQVTQRAGIDQSGYRLIVNTHADAGQEIFHVHWHVLGGAPLGPMLSTRS